MAEGFFRHYSSDNLEVCSAGLEPKGLNSIAIQVMKEIGIDISGHTSDHVTKYAGQSFDYVITVCDVAARNCPVFPGAGIRLHWPIEDPAEAKGTKEQVLAIFRRIRDEIGRKTKNWLEVNRAAER